MGEKRAPERAKCVSSIGSKPHEKDRERKGWLKRKEYVAVFPTATTKGIFQELLDRQGRAITVMYPSTPIHPLLSEAGLIPAQLLLDARQKSSAYRLLTLPDYHPTKRILPISLREGDENSQRGEQPEDTLT